MNFRRLFEGDKSENAVHFMLVIDHPANLVRPRSWWQGERERGALQLIIRHFNLGNRGKWLRIPVDIKEANKQDKIYVTISCLILDSFVLC